MLISSSAAKINSTEQKIPPTMQAICTWEETIINTIKIPVHTMFIIRGWPLLHFHYFQQEVSLFCNKTIK